MLAFPLKLSNKKYPINPETFLFQADCHRYGHSSVSWLSWWQDLGMQDAEVASRDLAGGDDPGLYEDCQHEFEQVL